MTTPPRPAGQPSQIATGALNAHQPASAWPRPSPCPCGSPPPRAAGRARPQLQCPAWSVPRPARARRQEAAFLQRPVARGRRPRRAALAVVGRRPHGGLGHSCQGKAQGARSTMHRPAKSGPLGRPPRPIAIHARPAQYGAAGRRRPGRRYRRLRGRRAGHLLVWPGRRRYPKGRGRRVVAFPTPSRPGNLGGGYDCAGQPWWLLGSPVRSGDGRNGRRSLLAERRVCLPPRGPAAASLTSCCSATAPELGGDAQALMGGPLATATAGQVRRSGN